MPSVKVEDIVIPEVRASSRLTPEQRAFFEGTVERFGVLQDILVRPLPDGRYELIAGKTRYEELKKRGSLEIPVKVIDANAKDALLMHIAENKGRGDTEPISEAKVIKAALDAGATEDEISKIYNHQPEWVRFTVSLLDLPEVYQKALQDGAIKVTHVREALRLPDDREAAAALSAAITHDWTTTVMHHYVDSRMAELEVARLKSERQGVKVPPPPPEPERLVRYDQCLVCGRMVPKENVSLPSTCNECYELAKYVTSQCGTGEEGMQRVYSALELQQAFETRKKEFLLQRTLGDRDLQPPTPKGPSETASPLPQRSQPIEDPDLRALIKRMLREELEKHPA